MNSNTQELAKEVMGDYILTDDDKRMLEQMEAYGRHEAGMYDVEDCFTENEKFDRRKFGKITCGCCGHQFNPYYAKTMKEGTWGWNWVGMDHMQPEAQCTVNCTKCKEELRFTIYVGQ